MKLIQTWRFHLDKSLCSVYCCIHHEEYEFDFTHTEYSGTSGSDVYDHIRQVNDGTILRITREDTQNI